MEELVKGFCIGETGKGLETKLRCAGGKVMQRHASKVKRRSSGSSSLPSFQGKAIKWLILEFTKKSLKVV